MTEVTSLKSMFDKIKEILLFTTTIFGLTLFAQRVHWYGIITWDKLWMWTQHAWYVIPLVAVIITYGVHALTKRRFWSNHHVRPPFTGWSETLFTSLTVAIFAFWLHNIVVLGFVAATYIPFPLDFLWTVSFIFSVLLIIRHLRFIRSDSPIHPSDIDIDVDAPIRDTDNDRLDRRHFARRLATVVTNRDPSQSVVIGVYGPWGSGKTSVLNLMKREIQTTRPKPVIVDFNPWYFGSDDQVIHQFFKELSAALSKVIGDEPSHLTTQLKAYADNISAVTVKLGPLGFSLKDPIPHSGKNQTVFRLREEIQEQLNKAGRRIVIIVDDLDRLERSELQTVFKLVKLIADFPYTSYVLAFDPEVVCTALNNYYAMEGNSFIGASFLEKIIQVPLRLPQADKKLMTQMVYQGLDNILGSSEIILPEDEAERFGNVWARTMINVLSTPRMVRRYLNAVSFAVPSLFGEVNTVDQMLLEALGVFFPPIYELIIAKPQLVMSGGRNVFGERRYKDAYKKEIEDKVFNALTEEETEALKVLVMELFPQTSIYWKNTSYGPEWESEWEEQKRICSQAYFNRYFLYGVATGDISDVGFTEFLNDFPASIDLADLKASILSLTRDEGFPRFLQKLRGVEKTLDENKSEYIALALSTMAENISQRDGFLGTGGSTWQLTAMLIAHLVKNLESERRDMVSKHIIQTTPSLTFALETLRWLRVKEEPESPTTQSDDIEHGENELVVRIKAEATSPEFLSKYGIDSKSLLLAWSHWGSKEEMQQTVRGWLRMDGAAKEFVKLFVPDAVVVETQRRTKSFMTKTEYDNLNAIFPAKELADLLHGKYPQLMTEDARFSIRDLGSKEAAVAQFLRLHRDITVQNPEGT